MLSISQRFSTFFLKEIPLLSLPRARRNQVPAEVRQNPPLHPHPTTHSTSTGKDNVKGSEGIACARDSPAEDRPAALNPPGPNLLHVGH